MSASTPSYMSTVEVIDLTASPTNSVIVIDDDLHDAMGPSPVDDSPHENSTPKKRRKKRSKGKSRDEGHVNGQHSVDDLPNDGTQTENNSAQQPRGQKRKRDVDWGSPSRPNSPPASNHTLFTIDTAGHPLKESSQTNYLQQRTRKTVEKIYHIHDGLFLPPHVSVASDTPLHTNGDAQEPDDRTLSPISDVSGIDFLDDDLVIGTPRYFHDTTTTKFPKTCKRCGDEGHDIKHCPNTICLTCGARNEHNSRNCPILRFCFNCQGKGHLAKDCPRIGPTDGRRTSARDCDRCGSINHHTTNCPTLWRIYTYLTDKERDIVLGGREEKRGLPFEEGGEGYIAGDHWCYNCGQSEHLGDDCKDARFNFDKPNDYSAFGLYNCLTGPFASSSQTPQYKRAPRSWEANERTRGGIPVDAQEDIGRKGREKAKKRARETQSRLEEGEEEDDTPDWFDQNRGKSKEKPRSNPRKEPSSSTNSAKPRQPLVFRITSEQKDPRFKSSREDSRPALLNRIDMDGEKDGSRSRDKDQSRDRNRGKVSRERGRSWDQRGRQRGDDYSQRQSDRYPPKERRWRGGYNR